MAPPGYMLDTDVVSALVRRPDGDLARRVGALPSGSLAISVVVAGALRYGAQRRGSARLTRQVEAILAAMDVLAPEEPVDRHYGEIRTALERVGQPIGQNDLWIAAHARALDATLATGTVREFRRVPGLAVEGWHQTPRVESGSD